MPIFRKVNKNFFKKWTREMAYILGFLFADGNIIYTKRGTWFWSVQITDKIILTKIKRAIGSSHKISKKKLIKNHLQLYRLQIGSKEMCEDLMCFGLTPQKSKNMRVPHMPPDFFRDFLRGYFDGDGGAWVGFKNKKRKNKIYVLSAFFTSGSENFLKELRDILRERGLMGGSLVKKERGFDLKYSVKDSLKLYEIMYNKEVSGLFLRRKRDKFESYIKMRS